MHSAPESPAGQLSRSEPIGFKNSPVVYGLGTLGLSSVATVFNGYYLFYFVDRLGLAVTLASIVSVVYAIWDAVNDPLVGYLSDNTRTRWGRRRPWLLAGLPFYVLFMVLVFSVPGFMQQGNALFWYALVITFLYEAASTVMHTNYEALFPELFRTFKERTRASAYNHGLGMIGELAGFSLAPILYTQFGFGGMVLFFAISSGVLLSVSIARNTEDPDAQMLPLLNLKSAFREALRDRPFWQFTLVATFGWFTTGVYTLAIPFYSKYTLGAGPQAPSLIFGTAFVVAILLVSTWAKRVREWGIKRTYLWAIAVMAGSAVVLGLAPNMTGAIVGAAIAGVGLAGVKVCREMILATLVDRSRKRSGQRSEGVYYSLNRFIGRLSRILEALALVTLGLLFGYVSGENPGPRPDDAFRFLISVFPFVCLVIAWLLARKLDLESDR